MNFSLKITVLGTVLAYGMMNPNAWAHGEGGTVLIGPKFAIQEEKEGVGFKLSAESIQFMGIQFSPPPQERIPASSWVAALDRSYLYVLRDGWIQKIDVATSARKTGTVSAMGGFRPGDQLVTQGVSAVRAADLEISSGEDHSDDEEEDEHGHDHHDGDHS